MSFSKKLRDFITSNPIENLSEPPWDGSEIPAISAKPEYWKLQMIDYHLNLMLMRL